MGGWGEIEIKAKLSPAEAGVWAELGKRESLRNLLTGGNYVPSRRKEIILRNPGLDIWRTGW